MATHPTLLVTGASGHLGRRVLELLLPDHAGHLVAATRSPDKLKELSGRGVKVVSADFDRPETLGAAFAGVDRALLISTDALDRPGRRLEQHRGAISAAANAAVKHVVYTSIVRPEAGSPVGVAEDHRITEETLAASKLGFTVLRNNLYSELLLGSLPRAVATGTLTAASGTGAVGYVTRDDCARAAAAALSSSFEGRRTLDITGPEALTHEQLAALATRLVGKPVKYQAIPRAALEAGMVSAGLPPPVAALVASFDEGAARGFLNVVSGAFQELTGRAPQSVEQFLKANQGALNG